MRLRFYLAATCCFAAPTALAAVSDEDFEELRQQLAAVSERLEQLATENAELKAEQQQTATIVADVQTDVADISETAANITEESWTDRIKLDGDFRYRYERLDVAGSDARRRNRIRARTNVRADLTDDVEIGFGLATGGDDPVSANQTLGAGGSSKSISLNLAYIDWSEIDGVHVIGGKFQNPLLRVGKQALMWDGDWTPEGFAVSYGNDWLFANGIGAWLESDSTGGGTNFAWGGQLAATGNFAGARITGGLAFFSIAAQGESTPFGDPADPGDYFGNTAVEPGGLACGTTPDTVCSYLYDYRLTEIFAEAAFKIGDWPAVIFADYVHNNDPDDNNIAWTFGGRIGQTKDRGQMEFAYFYADKEADSVFGLVTDSDFGGGGTDNRGHMLKFMYGINETWSVGAQYYINEIDVSSGNKRDYNRLFVDTQWKWK